MCLHSQSFSPLLAFLIAHLGISSVGVAADSLSITEQARYEDLNARGLQTFTNVDMADYLSLRHRMQVAGGQTRDPPEEVVHFAQKAKGEQVRLNAVRFDWAESDCVVHVERCLSAALASDWQSFRLIADRIRYKGGVVTYRERNFSTLGDWLESNSWLFTDVTPALSGSESFTFAIRPKIFQDFPAAPGSKYTRTIFKGSDYAAPAQVATDSFIPKARIFDILADLRNGDIVLILVKSPKGHLGCNHMGVVSSTTEEVSMVAPAGLSVKSVPLAGMGGYDAVAGFKFLRLQTDARNRAAIESAAVTTQPASPRDEDSKCAPYSNILRRLTNEKR